MPKRKKRPPVSEDTTVLLWISCSKIDVEVNTAVCSDEDAAAIRAIVDGMKESIYIDRTYVVTKGNPRRDAFIVEDRWYKFCRLIIETDFGNNSGRKINDFILGVLQTLAEVYLYQVVELYGYSPEVFELYFPEDCEILSDYEIDLRREGDPA